MEKPRWGCRLAYLGLWGAWPSCHFPGAPTTAARCWVVCRACHVGNVHRCPMGGLELGAGAHAVDSPAHHPGDPRPPGQTLWLGSACWSCLARRPDKDLGPREKRPGGVTAVGQSQWDQLQVPEAEFSLLMAEGLPEPRPRAGKPRKLQAKTGGSRAHRSRESSGRGWGGHQRPRPLASEL